jgi:hypothetical protein
MKRGKTHKIVTAYSALATVALGLIAFDTVDRQQPRQPAKILAARKAQPETSVGRMLASLARQFDSRASLAAAK